MKTYATIVTIALLACFAVIFWPQEPSEQDKILINQRDESLLKAKALQVKYDSTEVKVKQLNSELLISRAAVKRSEEKLTLAKDNEKRALRLFKEQTRLMSDVEADSVLKYRFRDDPDSIGQKVVYELVRLDQCDSVRESQSLLMDAFRHQNVKYDSLLDQTGQLIELCHQENGYLLEASLISSKIISSKDKQIKKQRKKVKILGVGIPVAFIAGLLIAL